MLDATRFFVRTYNRDANDELVPDRILELGSDREAVLTARELSETSDGVVALSVLDGDEIIITIYYAAGDLPKVVSDFDWSQFGGDRTH